MSRGSTPLWSCILEKISAQEASSNSDRCVKHRCLAVKHTHTRPSSDSAAALAAV